MTDQRRGSAPPGNGEDDLLRRAKDLAGRGRRSVEELARKVLGRVKTVTAPQVQKKTPARPAGVKQGKKEAQRKGTGREPGVVEPSAPGKAKASPPGKAKASPPAEVDQPLVVEVEAPPPAGPQVERWALTGGHAVGLEPEMVAALSWVDLPPDERPATVEDFTLEELAGVDALLPELPEHYDELRVVLLARDPGWLYAYWDLSAEVRERLHAHQGALALRLHDVTDSEFDGTRSWWRSLHWVPPESSHVYLPAPAAGRVYLVELGLYEEASQERAAPRFLSLARSDGALAPEAGPSMSREEVFTAVPAQGPPRPPEEQPALESREGAGSLGLREAQGLALSADGTGAWDLGGGGPVGAMALQGDGSMGPVPSNGRGQGHEHLNEHVHPHHGAPGGPEAPPPWSGVHAQGPGGPSPGEAPPPWSGVHAQGGASESFVSGNAGDEGDVALPVRGHPA